MTTTQKIRLPWSQSHTSPFWYLEHFRIYRATPELERNIPAAKDVLRADLVLDLLLTCHTTNPSKTLFPALSSPSHTVMDKACIYKFLKFILLEEQSRPRQRSPQNAGTEPPTREGESEGNRQRPGPILHKPPQNRVWWPQNEGANPSAGPENPSPD